LKNDALTKAAPPPFKNQRIALVLQGGGALGAYQAGVYHAMEEHGVTPDWVVGTSIGAINAAIIAGNPPGLRLARLREFWDGVAHPDLVDLREVPDIMRQFNTWLTSVDATFRGVPGFFSPRTVNPFAFGLPVAPEGASFYTTDALADTLKRLVDFDYLNQARPIRLTVGAMRVTCGTMTNFDSASSEVRLEHVMASGALPPGFPPIRIDGELYWDGGLYSNTPLETVLDDQPYRDTVCFMVDLWSPNGSEPETFEEVYTRQKDVTFASRTERHLRNYVRTHALRRKLSELYALLPAELKSDPKWREVGEMGTDSTIHIVRLAYAGRDWKMASKDVNFSHGSIQWRWEQGYDEAVRAIQRIESFVPNETGVVVHESISSGRFE
jgi:NTE family protein